MGRADRVDPATERRVLGLVGLGIRARNAVVGVEQLRVAARKGNLFLAIVAPDASAHSRKKVIPLMMARGIRVVEGPGAATLGAATGRVSTAAVGITDAALARGIKNVLDEQAAPSGAAGRQEARRASAQKGLRRIG